LNTLFVSPLLSQSQSMDSGPLWQLYCQLIGAKPFDQVAAMAAWDGWLRSFVPDERDRAAIPLLVLLQSRRDSQFSPKPPAAEFNRPSWEIGSSL
jgi:hypothetical protein